MLSSPRLKLSCVNPRFPLYFAFDHTITQQQEVFSAATNYTVYFAENINQTNIFAMSEPFEIKALGAAYPTMTSSTGPSSSGSGSGTASGSSAQTASKSGAMNLRTYAATSAGALIVVGAIIFAGLAHSCGMAGRLLGRQAISGLRHGRA